MPRVGVTFSIRFLTGRKKMPLKKCPFATGIPMGRVSNLLFREISLVLHFTLLKDAIYNKLIFFVLLFSNLKQESNDKKN